MGGHGLGWGNSSKGQSLLSTSGWGIWWTDEGAIEDQALGAWVTRGTCQPVSEVVTLNDQTR